MPKHNQSARLGDLTDFAAVPPSDPDARTTALERRVTTLEALLNDVMQQLDRPYKQLDPPHREPRTRGNGKPKPTPVKRQRKGCPSKPTETAFLLTPELREKKTAREKEQQAASAAATATALEKMQALLSTSDRLTEKDFQAAGISTNRLKKVRASQAYKESGIKCEGAKGKPREYWVGD